MRNGRDFLLLSLGAASVFAIGLAEFDRAWSINAMHGAARHYDTDATGATLTGIIKSESTSSDRRALLGLAQTTLGQKLSMMPQSCEIEYLVDRGTAPKVKYSNIPETMLDTRRPVDRIAAMISSNEGSPTAIDWNDCGKGVSVGMFQANQKVGQLPDLLHELSKDQDGRIELQKAFGPHVTNKIAANPDVVKILPFSPNNNLGRGLRQLTHSDVFQKLQIKVLRRKINSAVKLAQKHGIKSSAGVAITADLANQWGDAGASRFLRCQPRVDDENVRLLSIVQAVKVASKYGDRYKSDLKKAVANDLSFTEPMAATIAE